MTGVLRRLRRRAARRWEVALQAVCGGFVLAALALAAHAGPTDVPLGTLQDMPVYGADPAAVALTMRAHGCVTREAWLAGHGTGLPGRLLMTRGTATRVVTVPDGWTLAGQGWTTTGWCTR